MTQNQTTIFCTASSETYEALTPRRFIYVEPYIEISCGGGVFWDKDNRLEKGNLVVHMSEYVFKTRCLRPCSAALKGFIAQFKQSNKLLVN